MNQRPNYIYIGLLDRTWGNRILYVLYRILNIMNNSFWYYFAPFVIT